MGGKLTEGLPITRQLFYQQPPAGETFDPPLIILDEGLIQPGSLSCNLECRRPAQPLLTPKDKNHRRFQPRSVETRI